MVLHSLIFLATASLVVADSVIYSHRQLLSGWQDASYDTETNYVSDTISVVSQPYGIFALKNPAVALSSFSGVRFDVKGDHPYLYTFLQSTKNTLNSKGVTLTGSINSDTFTTITVDFSSLPLASGPWDTISLQTSDTGATYEVDNVILLS